jgi:hypothetical protein
MDSSIHPRHRGLGIAGLLAATIPLTGCLAGSLATSTGALPGETWSDASEQPAHVGETVRLSFVLRDAMAPKSIHAAGLADYCVFTVGDATFDAELDDSGAFLSTYELVDHRPGDVVAVEATAYRQQGARDHMLIAGEWVSNESPRNPPDQRVANDRVNLRIYQAQVAIAIPPIADGLDPITGRMVFRRETLGDTVVYAHRPPRDGFTLTEQPGGGSLVEYTPTGSQLNPTGTTRVDFTIHDFAGNRHEYHQILETPYR